MTLPQDLMLFSSHPWLLSARGSTLAP